MRATPIVGVALTLIALSACGRSASDLEASRPVGVPVSNDFSSSVPVKTAGQPRLSALAGQQRQSATMPQPSNAPQRERGAAQRAPMASYASYDGRGPGDPLIPRGIEQRQGSSTRSELATGPQPGGKVPPRDVVDLKLGAEQRKAAASEAARNTKIKALRNAPAPLPRPVAKAPTPTLRPVEVAAIQPAAVPAAPAQPRALPARPSVVTRLGASLAAPQVLRDETPTGLPKQPVQGGAIPLGTLPASLGLANLRAAEAALPASDTLEQSGADESGALGWSEASDLLRAGEVKSASDIGEFEVLMTLCSGVGVITIQPTPGALAEVNWPKVICGKSVSLTSQ